MASNSANSAFKVNLDNISAQADSLHSISKNVNDICLRAMGIKDGVIDVSTLIRRIRILKTVFEVTTQANHINKLSTALEAVIHAYTLAEDRVCAVANADIYSKPLDYTGLRGRYESQDDYIDKRIANAVDDNTRKMYLKYKDAHYKENGNKKDGVYNFLFNTLDYDKAGDADNARGTGYTYFHEYGHMVDDKSKLLGNVSDSNKYHFYDKLKQDYDNYVDKVMKENGYTSKQEAYDHISTWLYEDRDLKNGISDLFTGLSGGDIRGKWSHPDSYYNSQSLSHEAFAHFFESGMRTDPAKLNYVKEVFPEAYEAFQQMLEDDLNEWWS